MTPTRRRALQGLVALLLLSVSSTAFGSEWDQAKATKLAGEPAPSVNEVYRSILSTPRGAQVGTGQAANYIRLKDRVRVAKNESKHLAKALEKGGTREETIHAWRRLMSLVRDAREVGRKMYHDAPTLEKIEKANALLDELAPFYEAKDGADGKDA